MAVPLLAGKSRVEEVDKRRPRAKGANVASRAGPIYSGLRADSRFRISRRPQPAISSDVPTESFLTA